jgi:predicted RNA-binding protein with PIN domain
MPVDSQALRNYNRRMSYLIDGHNLIPHIRGLNLGMMDDEERLIALLKVFCRERHTQVECYFDNAPLGIPRTQRYGRVVVHFIPAGRIADDAILAKLVELKRDARNWIVVSSDQRVQMGAREAHAQVLPADAFAGILEETIVKTGSSEKQADIELGSEEVNEWLRLFNQKPHTDLK